MEDGFDEGACDVFVVSPLDSLVPAEAKRFLRLADMDGIFFLLRPLGQVEQMFHGTSLSGG